jgi:nucleoside-diphosphate-sugar epimerase
MRVLVTGAAGMVGRKLAERLAREGAVGGRAVAELTLLDTVEAATPDDASVPIANIVGDLATPGTLARLVEDRPDVVFHLAAVVSGEAEADFDKGYRVNLEGMRLLLEAIRGQGDAYRPRLVFSSSIAVFGPPFPDVIGDDQGTTPRTSYGTQKAVAELLVADHSRRGLVDGVSIRLPTICVRPGAPNRAASGFFSSIIREPLNGQEAILPVPDDVRHWFASPRAAVGFLLHAASLPREAFVERPSLTMPGVSATVSEQIAALRAVGGDDAARLIRREPDETIMRIVSVWPQAFDAHRALELGFRAEESFEEIVRAHVEDELGSRVA